jgi:hypothetical protein
MGRSARESTRVGVVSGGREAVTEFMVLEPFGSSTLIEVHLGTPSRWSNHCHPTSRRSSKRWRRTAKSHLHPRTAHAVLGRAASLPQRLFSTPAGHFWDVPIDSLEGRTLE